MVVPTDIQVAFITGALFVDLGRRYIESEHSASPERSRLAYCPFRNLSVIYASMVRLRADSKTESFRRLYRARAPVIEGVFAEAKQWHSLGRAWRRGLRKMRVQSLLVAAIINFKRVMTTTVPLLALLFAFRSLIRLLRSHMRSAQRCQHDSPSLQPILG